MTAADELQARTFRFALDVLSLSDAYPRTVAGRTVASQLVDAGTSVGANYRSARRARSKREFASTLGVVKTEADEAEYWLEITAASGLIHDTARVQTLLGEAGELRAIFVRSYATALEALRAARTRRMRT